MLLKVRAGLALLGFMAFASGFAQAQTVSCLSHGSPLAINNTDILNWKATSRNQFRSRAHLSGTFIKRYADQTGHEHFEVQIGSQSSDTIEIIYNQEFGSIPAINPRAVIEACGDYITANASVGGYKASPDGAIVHWVHQSTNPSGHDSGFVMVDGKIYGQNAVGKSF
jgi:hypothetical protein